MKIDNSSVGIKARLIFQAAALVMMLLLVSFGVVGCASQGAQPYDAASPERVVEDASRIPRAVSAARLCAEGLGAEQLQNDVGIRAGHTNDTQSVGGAMIYGRGDGQYYRNNFRGRGRYNQSAYYGSALGYGPTVSTRVESWALNTQRCRQPQTVKKVLNPPAPRFGERGEWETKTMLETSPAPN